MRKPQGLNAPLLIGTGLADNDVSMSPPGAGLIMSPRAVDGMQSAQRRVLCDSRGGGGSGGGVVGTSGGAGATDNCSGSAAAVYTAGLAGNAGGAGETGEGIDGEEVCGYSVCGCVVLQCVVPQRITLECIVILQRIILQCHTPVCVWHVGGVSYCVTYGSVHSVGCHVHFLFSFIFIVTLRGAVGCVCI